jgi:multiple sugar transport system substrate-binding protein
MAAAFSVLALGMTAACGGGSAGSSDAVSAKGPIKVWYSNNPDEIKWGKAMVSEWNAAHPKEKVTGQEIPAGKTSEEVIGAAITAGNAPCLVFNTSPAAVPQFQKQGGLVPLNDFPGGQKYVESRSGSTAQQYKSPDGNYYQIPWKSNPVMIFYNKAILKKAGVNPKNPPLATYDQFLATSRKIVKSGAAKAAIWPAPTSEFFQSWFDFYPLYAAESGGSQLVENGKATFDDAAGKKVADFWHTMYADGLSQKELYNGDAFADGKAGMAIVGPWAIPVYGPSVDWGVAPVPTSNGMSPGQIHTFSDAKNIAIYSACKNQGTAWDVLKFATSKDQDGKLLETTGQMPLRANLKSTYPDYFSQNPEYNLFADQASRTVEVPNVPNSVAIWQEFRDNYTSAVIFGKTPVGQFLSTASQKATDLADQS